ncbi:nadh-ubiquinone oxidoreductase b14 subunit [Trichoderma arundinaceum]|uniref:Nadh-ubiquinone oxidoreductase b14 subunit n=1 Tax=Trichoderma arundinaceum TaxID=490622 RepID=A0A395NW65_TRIAR|nr:nadh-ubiquinone oxidoreductase b14 subunit [Trichoderma arundinaceum]
MAITPTQFAKKTVQCEPFTLLNALMKLTSNQRPVGRMRSVESFLPTANGSEVYVPRSLFSSLYINHELENMWTDERLNGPETKLTGEMQAPEIQTMYNIPLPVSTLRTRIRQEFERNRFANQLSVVDVLLFKSHAEYQETMNFWKQQTHILAYFNDNFRGDKRLPSSFMSGFLEGRN